MNAKMCWCVRGVGNDYCKKGIGKIRVKLTFSHGKLYVNFEKFFLVKMTVKFRNSCQGYVHIFEIYIV